MSEVPDGITYDHVLTAMSQVGSDPSAWPPKSRSTKYDVVDPRTGARLPPKLVSSEAARIATGRALSRRVFYGGDETNERLMALGFRIVLKEPDSIKTLPAG